MFMLGDLLRSHLSRPNARWVSGGALVAAGLVTATVVAITGSSGSGEAPAQADSFDSCQVRERTETYPFSESHPGQDFYEPAESVPEDAFGHVIGDGLLIVHYHPELPDDQREQLRGFVTELAWGRVVAASAPEQPEALKAVNAYTTLVCDSFDLAALQEFTRGWFEDPRSELAQ